MTNIMRGLLRTLLPGLFLCLVGVALAQFGASERGVYLTIPGVAGTADPDRLEVAGFQEIIQGDAIPGKGGVNLSLPLEARMELIVPSDVTSPQLMRLMGSNTTFTAMLEICDPSPDGFKVVNCAYRINLTNCQIESMRQWRPSSLDPAGDSLGGRQFDIVTLVYNTIEWSIDYTNLTGKADTTAWEYDMPGNSVSNTDP